NNPAPVLLARQGQVNSLDDPSQPIGLYRDTRPQIKEVELETGLTVVLFSDGIIHAGSRQGLKMNAQLFLEELLTHSPDAGTIADAFMGRALELDQNRPVDDTSVVVLQVIPASGDQVRRMSVRLPLGP
ncbi:MAG: SpoIIE family protein phosphatase, partial [Anaerolineales bacterium]|nr:SpoIIE family protein phosphatase [Anaerolineales bacterium]